MRSKVLFLLGIALSVSASLAGAQQSPPQQEGIAMMEGRLVYVKTGTAQRVVQPLQLSEGITAEPNGKISLKDKREVFLQNGQILLLDGHVTDLTSEVRGLISAAEERRPMDRRFTDSRKDDSSGVRVSPLR